MGEWAIYEREETVGGLARSFRDAQGCTWDIGGHVVFSHYGVFTRLLTDLLGAEGLAGTRAYLLGAHRGCLGALSLPTEYPPSPAGGVRGVLRTGLMTAALQADARPCANFDDYIFRTFGEGIANLFMRPYNRKVWACDPREMAARSANASPCPTRCGCAEYRAGAGRHRLAEFPFPFSAHRRHGAYLDGAGGSDCRGKIDTGCAAVAVDIAGKCVHFADGTTREDAALISTIPVTELARMSGNDELIAIAEPLVHSATHVIGVGLRGEPSAHLRDKCWMYFPRRRMLLFTASRTSAITVRITLTTSARAGRCWPRCPSPCTNRSTPPRWRTM